MRNKKLNKSVDELRAHRASGQDLDNSQIKLRTQKLPVNREIDTIIRVAQKEAEAAYLMKFGAVRQEGEFRKQSEAAMQQGNVEEAAKWQKKDIDKNNLLRYNSNR